MKTKVYQTLSKEEMLNINGGIIPQIPIPGLLLVLILLGESE